MHGIDHDESTSADNTDVFLNANTASTLPKVEHKEISCILIMAAVGSQCVPRTSANEKPKTGYHIVIRHHTWIIVNKHRLHCHDSLLLLLLPDGAGIEVEFLLESVVYTTASKM